ncbi:MAG TPA: toll/interleukin-1 receptor domain-containing protein, partial [Acidimicrobiales bacterium]|nr:toll/interleukin-1 receptor domain-containing protein [Acidimicrobiales bacterium]
MPDTAGPAGGATLRRVFISYRRGETSGQARALHDRLAQHFGAERVFMDVDSIAPGADFAQQIEEAINS